MDIITEVIANYYPVFKLFIVGIVGKYSPQKVTSTCPLIFRDKSQDVIGSSHLYFVVWNVYLIVGNDTFSVRLFTRTAIVIELR